MKVLILVPDIKTLGGIQSYYTKLKSKFKVPVEYFTIGRRSDENGLLSKWLRIIKDYLFFLHLLRDNKYTIVHINPSLDYKMFFREGLFFLITKIKKKKTILFFHSWRKSFEKIIDKYGPSWIFKSVFGNASLYIVLADDFKKKLREWGCTQPIYKEVTVIEDEYLQNINIQKYIADRLQSDIKQILFLARITREKGVYETIDAFRILHKKYPKVKLVIAGEGPELRSVQTYAKDSNIKNVYFPGDVRGQKKNELLQNSHILCLPTYGEGFPLTIVEAMASGIPVVTRPVGGIADFFENERHGYSIDSKDPKVFANYIEKLINNKELYLKISLSNYEYAISNFIASDAARRLEKIYNLS